jgi:hypothetical protein
MLGELVSVSLSYRLKPASLTTGRSRRRGHAGAVAPEHGRARALHAPETKIMWGRSRE